MAQTIYERYGGFSTVRKIVSAFYDSVLDSENLAKFFEKTDMQTQIDHQAKFISSIMGGPASYTDEQLHKVHRNLNITDRDFDEIAELLIETLEDFDLEQDDIDYIAGAFEKRRMGIIGVIK